MGATLLLGGQIDDLPGAVSDPSGRRSLRQDANSRGLVRIPLKPGELLNGTSTAGTSGAAASYDNPDGTQTAWSLAAPAITGSVTSSAYVETRIRGPRVGVRFRSTSSAAPFSVTVDGRVFKVDNVKFRRNAATTLAGDEFEARFIVDGLAPHRYHTVRVSLAAEPAGGAARSLVLFGWLGDRVAGYEEPPKTEMVWTSAITPTTTFTRIVPNTVGQLISGVSFDSTDAAAQDVEVVWGASNTDRRRFTVPAGGHIDVPFARARQSSSQLGVKIRTVNSVTTIKATPREVSA